MATNEPIMIDELFGELDFSKAEEKWVVVYTKPKREKKLAKYAAENQITYYLPLIESIRRYKDREVKFTKPLFSGYIFFKCDFHQKRTLIASGHIVTFIRVPNEAEFLGELQQIYLGKEQGAEYEPGEYFEAGCPVKIIAGPFEGLTGVVKNQKDVRQVMLRVNMLHQAVALTVQSTDVEILDLDYDEE
ncbi:MAG: transcription termination/antitermination NusG family protein [Candidatus Cloacimonadales bacterium]